MAYGLGAATPFDLAAIGFSRRESDVDAAQEAARGFITSGKRLLGIADVTAEQLQQAFGLDRFEVLRAQALMELGRRTALAGKGPIESISSPADVFKLLSNIQRERKEHFYAILLDAKNNVLRKCLIHVGTLTASLVGAREIFREAIREGASAIIVAHNHPSGDPTPSPEDIQVTGKLKGVGEMLDIPLLDHVIIGDARWTSLHEEGHL